MNRSWSGEEQCGNAPGRGNTVQHPISETEPESLSFMELKEI